MSIATAELELVSAEQHRRLELLPRTWYRVAPHLNLVCSLCGRPAVFAYLSHDGTPMPKCQKHARDF